MKTHKNANKISEETGARTVTIVAFWFLLIIIAIITITIALIHRWLATYFLEREIAKAVPKNFQTNLALENRYNIIRYHCNILKKLLDLNNDYNGSNLLLFSGSAFAYNKVLKQKFSDLNDYILEILNLDFKHYFDAELCSMEINELKNILGKSFVYRYYGLKTYVALDTFAEYSKILTNKLKQINPSCKPKNNENTDFIRELMLSDIQTYHSQFEGYLGIRKKVYCTFEKIFCEDFGGSRKVYHTLGHKKHHFFTLLGYYVTFIESYYKNRQVIWDFDVIVSL